MTNPIPGADSERLQLDFEQWALENGISVDRFGAGFGRGYYDPDQKLWLAYKAGSARAAAKVGANVAADILGWEQRCEALDLKPSDAMRGEIADLRRYIAAGAPAETGASVAISLPIDLKWDEKSKSYLSQPFALSDIAYGAPAETPMGIIPASVDLNAPGEVNEKLLTYLNTADQTAPAETPKPTWDYETFGIPNEEIAEMWRISGHSGTVPFSFASRVEARMVEVLAAQPAPAPIADSDLVKRLQGQVNDLHKLLEIRKSSDERIERLAPIAGDVEKDARDAQRYRKIKADNDDCDAETFCLFFDSKSGGLISIESKDMDAELDSAMLSNSSSGEAG